MHGRVQVRHDRQGEPDRTGEPVNLRINSPTSRIDRPISSQPSGMAGCYRLGAHTAADTEDSH